MLYAENLSDLSFENFMNIILGNLFDKDDGTKVPTSKYDFTVKDFLKRTNLSEKATKPKRM